MADNLNVPGGSAGPAATDEIGGIHFQRIKLVHGADGVNAGDVATGNPLPVYLVNVERAEDAAHSTGHTGLPLLAVRSDTAAALAGTTGDYLPLTTDSTGRAWVNAENLTAPVGAVGETAPASDTASSGLNGRLQRIAQRLTSLIALLPASLGQKTAANSLAVTVASDQSAISVTTAPSKLIVYKIAATTVAATASTYTTGDVIGGKLTLTNVLSGDSLGRLNSITLQMTESSTVRDLDVFIFDSDPSASTLTDSTGLDIDGADDEKVIAIFRFDSTEFNQSGSNAYATKQINMVVKAASGSTLYAALVSGEDSWVWGAANGMAVTFTFEQY